MYSLRYCSNIRNAKITWRLSTKLHMFTVRYFESICIQTMSILHNINIIVSWASYFVFWCLHFLLTQTVNKCEYDISWNKDAYSTYSHNHYTHTHIFRWMKIQHCNRFWRMYFVYICEMKMREFHILFTLNGKWRRQNVCSYNVLWVVFYSTGVFSSLSFFCK